MGIKVKATAAGFYDYYREPGVEFEIRKEHDFSEVWMVKIPAGKSKKAAPQPVPAEAEAVADSEVI